MSKRVTPFPGICLLDFIDAMGMAFEVIGVLHDSKPNETKRTNALVLVSRQRCFPSCMLLPQICCVDLLCRLFPSLKNVTNRIWTLNLFLKQSPPFYPEAEKKILRKAIQLGRLGAGVMLQQHGHQTRFCPASILWECHDQFFNPKRINYKRPARDLPTVVS